MWGVFFSLLVRSGVILGAAELMRHIMRRSSAADRHRILRTGLVLFLLWPALAAILPEIPLRLPAFGGQHEQVTVRQGRFYTVKKMPVRRSTNGPLVIWLAGAVLTLLPVASAYRSVRRLARQALPLDNAGWQELLAEECSRMQITPVPKLSLHPAQPGPFTFGWYAPRIVLPADCLAWSISRRRAVLIHELAHSKRRDLLWQLLANIATVVWWFQPLIWWNRRKLRQESERACDAAVLEAGVRPSEYANELLGIVRRFASGGLCSPASTAMAQGGDLQGRLRAILSSPPKPVRRLSAAAIPVLIVVAASVSALAVSSQQSYFSGGHLMKRTVLSGLLASAGLSAATIGGAVFDASGLAIANAQASLYNPDTSANQQTTTGSDGKFSFDSLAAGSYILHIEKPGFASLYREFNLQTDTDVHRGLTLQTTPANESGADSAPSQDASPPALLRVGGTVAENNLIHKVQPVYPPSAKAAHVQGTVQLDVTITKQGEPVDLQVVSSPDDRLTQSSLEAVRQWRYRPTLLNGEPVDILTRVIVNYTLRD